MPTLIAALILAQAPATQEPVAPVKVVRVDEAAYAIREGKRVKGYKMPTYRLELGNAIELKEYEIGGAAYFWGDPKISVKGVLGKPVRFDIPRPATPPDEPPIVGGATHFTLTFRAEKVGRTIVEMSYVGPTERRVRNLERRVRFAVTVVE